MSGSSKHTAPFEGASLEELSPGLQHPCSPSTATPVACTEVRQVTSTSAGTHIAKSGSVNTFAQNPGNTITTAGTLEKIGTAVEPIVQTTKFRRTCQSPVKASATSEVPRVETMAAVLMDAPPQIVPSGTTHQTAVTSANLALSEHEVASIMAARFRVNAFRPVHPLSSAAYQARQEQPEPPLDSQGTRKPHTFNRRSSQPERTTWQDVSEIINPAGIVRYCGGVFATTLSLLKLPLCILLMLFVVLYICQQWLFMAGALLDRTTGMVCRLPLTGYLNMCAQAGQPSYVQSIADPYFEQVMIQDKQLAVMPDIASDSAALPFRLISGQSDFRQMVYAFSVGNPEARRVLLPLLADFDRYVDEAIDGIQDTLASTNALIDNTIIVNSWAATKLQRIENDNNWIRAAAVAVGLRAAPVAEVIVIFSALAERRVSDANAVRGQYHNLGAALTNLRETLNSVANKVLVEGNTAREGQLAGQTIWRRLSNLNDQKSQAQMRQFGSTLLHMRKLLNYLVEAGRVVDASMHVLHDMTSKIRVVREQLMAANDSISFGGSSLGLTVQSIEVSIRALEESRTSLKAAQNDRKAKFEGEKGGRR